MRIEDKKTFLKDVTEVRRLIESEAANQAELKGGVGESSGPLIQPLEPAGAAEAEKKKPEAADWEESEESEETVAEESAQPEQSEESETQEAP